MTNKFATLLFGFLFISTPVLAANEDHDFDKFRYKISVPTSTPGEASIYFTDTFEILATVNAAFRYSATKKFRGGQQICPSEVALTILGGMAVIENEVVDWTNTTAALGVDVKELEKTKILDRKHNQILSFTLQECPFPILRPKNE